MNGGVINRHGIQVVFRNGGVAVTAVHHGGFAELFGVHLGFQDAIRLVEATHKPDGYQFLPRLLFGLHNFAAIFRRGCQRFFTKHVFSGLNRPDYIGLVYPAEGGDQDGIYVRIGH